MATLRASCKLCLCFNCRLVTIHPRNGGQRLDAGAPPTYATPGPDRLFEIWPTTCLACGFPSGRGLFERRGVDLDSRMRGVPSDLGVDWWCLSGACWSLVRGGFGGVSSGADTAKPCNCKLSGSSFLTSLLVAPIIDSIWIFNELYIYCNFADMDNIYYLYL